MCFTETGLSLHQKLELFYKSFCNQSNLMYNHFCSYFIYFFVTRARPLDRTSLKMGFRLYQAANLHF